MFVQYSARVIRVDSTWGNGRIKQNKEPILINNLIKMRNINYNNATLGLVLVSLDRFRTTMI